MGLEDRAGDKLRKEHDEEERVRHETSEGCLQFVVVVSVVIRRRQAPVFVHYKANALKRVERNADRQRQTHQPVNKRLTGMQSGPERGRQQATVFKERENREVHGHATCGHGKPHGATRDGPHPVTCDGVNERRAYEQH